METPPSLSPLPLHPVLNSIVRIIPLHKHILGYGFDKGGNDKLLNIHRTYEIVKGVRDPPELTNQFIDTH